VPAELRCFAVVTLVVPGRAKDEAGKAILTGSPRTTPVISNILFHPVSNAGCSRITLDVARRVTDLLRLFPVAPWSYPGRSRITQDVYRGYARMLVRLQLKEEEIIQSMLFYSQNAYPVDGFYVHVFCV
jgi:hypothetical protein